ncbi:MAG TPA: hypothetical protein VIX82_03690, partial [Solirubrobacteraceae bacterium]
QQYSRPPYREVASYIDGAAGPHDPVIAVGLLSPALAVYLERPHYLVASTDFPWKTVPRGTGAWLLTEEDVLTPYLHVQIPHEPGLRLIELRHYTGLTPITMRYYRREP